MKRTASILEIARRSSANSSCLDRDYSLDSIASRSTASNVSRTSSQVVWSFTIHNRRTNCLLTMVDDRHACSPQNTRASTVRFRLGRASSPTPTGLARKPPRGGLPDSYRIAPRLVGSRRIAHSLSAWNPATRSGACPCLAAGRRGRCCRGVADLRAPERFRSGSDHGFDRDVHGAHLLAGSWVGHLIPGLDRHAGGECDAGRHGRRRRPLQPYSTDPQLLA